MGYGEVGDRLKWARQEKGLTRPALGEKAGISKAAITELETHARYAPSIEMIARLAAVLDVERCWLAYGDKDKAPKGWIGKSGESV